MFCDGVCKKKNKKCGLLTEIIMEKKDGDIKNEEMCVFQATLHSALRSEGQRDGLHAAENSTRNEMVAGIRKIKDVLATGMIGMLKAVNDRTEDRFTISDK